MTNIEGTKNLETKELDKVFKCEIIKLLLIDNRYTIFYKNFLSFDQNFCYKKTEEAVDILFILMSKYDFTIIRPNNFSGLDNSEFNKNIQKFSDDIYTFLELNHSNIVCNGKKIFENLDFTYEKDLVDEVQTGLRNYLKEFYDGGGTDIGDLVHSVEDGVLKVCEKI